MDAKEKRLFRATQWSSIIEMYAENAYSQRRVTLKEYVKDFRDTVEEIFKYINYFNSLPENTTIILDHPVEDWYILDEFKDFILPNSVRYEAGNMVYPDLLVRTECAKSDIKDLDFNVYKEKVARFRGCFKRNDVDDRVTLASLRIDKSFEDVRNKAAYFCDDDLVCRYLSDRFIPVELEGVDSILGLTFVNTSVLRIIKDYIASLQF